MEEIGKRGKAAAWKRRTLHTLVLGTLARFSGGRTNRQPLFELGPLLPGSARLGGDVHQEQEHHEHSQK
jgi:hypothetical protein